MFFRTVTRINQTPFHLILPDVASFNWISGLLAIAAAYALLRLHLPLIPVLVAAALASAAVSLL